MGDVWESSALIEEVWESGSTPGVEWTVVIREGDIVTGGSGADLSDTTPQALGTAAPGVGTEASRADHVHDMPTAADTGAIPESIIDAKGDLVVGTAADTAARLAVGTNGQVLTADSSEAGGVKWAAAGGDVSVAGNCRVFAPQTGGYGWAMWVGGSTVSISNTIVTASFPFTVTEDCTLSTLRIEVMTGAASATHQLALFSCDVNGTPGSLIETFTTFDCSGTGVKGISGLTTALYAGSIYVLASLGGATSGHSLRGVTTGGGGLALANGAVVLEIATTGDLTGGGVGRGAGWRFTVVVPGVMTDPPGGVWAHAPTNLTIPNIGMVLT